MRVLGDISGICLQGGNFKQDTKLKFFDLPSQRAYLLYGRNGTGKTTVSRAFQLAVGQNMDGIQTAKLINYNDQLIDLTDDDRKNIFVYNEEYIERKIKLQNDGLQTIVLLGSQIELEEQIKAAEKNHVDIQKKVSEQEKIRAQYLDAKNIVSPSYHKKKCLEALRGDENWAGKEREILGHKNNTSVTEEIVQHVLKAKSNKDESTLRSDYQQKYEILVKARTGRSKPLAKIKLFPQFEFDREKATALLRKKIENPELSEREQKLFEMLSEGKTEQLQQMKTFFEDSTLTECPFCLQKVSVTYKQDLAASIQRILSKEVENHKKELEHLVLRELFIEDLASYKEVDSSLVDKIEAALKDLNQSIGDLNECIQNKIANPYNPVMKEILDINQKKQCCVELLACLNKSVEVYNSKITNIKALQNELRNINDELAYLKIKPIYDTWSKQNAEQEDVEKVYKELQLEEAEIAKNKETLISQKKNIKIAVELINRSLNYIFFSPNRLKLEVHHDELTDSDSYVLFSKGQSVKPSQVSVGERNIIALAYFFTEIFNQSDPSEGYCNESFVVIDDPVSSFDFENKIGILSFFKAKFREILSGNENSKILVMTHDFETMFGLEKAISEILDRINEKQEKNKYRKDWGELCNGNIEKFNNSRNEYCQMMKTVYQYACDSPQDMDITIGNVIRRVVEAFATFLYQTSIEKLSCNEDILATLPDKTTRDYFENFMYRLVLNGQSHMSERIKIVKDYTFTQCLSRDEIQKTAQSILCFMYLLQKQHVIVCLKGKKHVVENIEKWCAEIKKSM